MLQAEASATRQNQNGGRREVAATVLIAAAIFHVGQATERKATFSRIPNSARLVFEMFPDRKLPATVIIPSSSKESDISRNGRRTTGNQIAVNHADNGRKSSERAQLVLLV